MTSESSTATPRPTPLMMPKNRVRAVPVSPPAQARILEPPAEPVAVETISPPTAPSPPILPPPASEADGKFCRWAIAELRGLDSDEQFWRKKHFLDRLDLPANIRALLLCLDEAVVLQGLVLAEVYHNRPYYESRLMLEQKESARLEGLRIGIEEARKNERAWLDAVNSRPTPPIPPVSAGATVSTDDSRRLEERRLAFVRFVEWMGCLEALKNKLKENDHHRVVKCVFETAGAATLEDLEVAKAEYERVRTEQTYRPESGNR